MKATDVKNNLLINELVKKHFSLTEKSQKLFTQRLMYERPIAKEYEEILKGSKDLRIRFDLKDDFLKEIDDSWSDFNDKFPSYINARNITYENFRKNKVTVNKNEKKIYKDLLDYYTREAKNWMYSIETSKSISILDDIDNAFHIGSYCDIFIKEFIRTKSNQFYADNNIDAYAETLSNFSNRDNNQYYREKFRKIFNKDCDYSEFGFLVGTDKNWKIGSLVTLADVLTTDREKEQFRIKAEENIIHNLTNCTKQIYERVIQQKTFTNKELELVFTLNYADWFLCSTGDSWSSCLSLHSTYDECYWTGIPNLIGDKSRAMVYITEKNGPKKDFYGIRTDKFIVRAWVQLFRTIPSPLGKQDFKGYNKTFFSVVKPYPVHLNGLEKLLEGIINIPTYNTIINTHFFNFGLAESYYKSRSRYYAENFWFKKNGRGRETMATIYLDDGSYKIANKNKAKYFYGDYGYYSFDADGGSAFQFQRMPIAPFNPKDITSLSQLLSSGISFSEIIEENSTLVEEINRWNNGYHRDNEDDYDEDDYDEEDDYAGQDYA